MPPSHAAAHGPYQGFLSAGQTRGLEDKSLSKGLLEDRKAKNNDWNQREHDLAVARRMANLSRQRVARSTAWANAAASFVQTVQKKHPETAGGLQCIENYRPLTKESPQILLVAHDGSPALACTLSVFRGSLQRKAGGTQVRTANQTACPLPADATKILHVVLLSPVPETSGTEFQASCLSTALIMEPANNVYGEVTCKTWSGGLRLHAKLSESSRHVLNCITKETLPYLPADIPAPKAKAAASAAETAPDTITPSEFADRAFMRQTLVGELNRFLKALRGAYETKGLGFVDSEGFVQLSSGKRERWDHLLQRAPGFFLSEMKDAKGHRFAQQVHRKLMLHLPTRGHSDSLFDHV